MKQSWGVKMEFASHWLFRSRIVYKEVLVTLKKLLGMENKHDQSDPKEDRSLRGDLPSGCVQIGEVRKGI